MSTRAERRAVQEQQRKTKSLSQMTETACEVVLVRHGETAYNAEERLQGQMLPGPGLTERGQRQAEALGERLKDEPFAAIYSSDLLRATETADIVVAARRAWRAARGSSGSEDGAGEQGSTGGADGTGADTGHSSSGSNSNSSLAAAAAQEQVRIDQELRERNLGVLQGLTRREAAAQHPEAFASLSAPVHEPGEGFPESLESLEARAEAVLQKLAARHPGRRILVICHGGFLSVTHMRAAGHHNRGKNVNASINTILIQAQGGTPPQFRWAVVHWGDEAHLEEVGALASAFGGGTEG